MVDRLPLVQFKIAVIGFMTVFQYSLFNHPIYVVLKSAGLFIQKPRYSRK